ncbi:MAG: M20/M25/M40 family metallo-hydrolase [Proteobacteria bacterium]|nr:M20/M25/M40 family metallo-hydrolase [Pseudomonadota bacterium]
MKTLATLMIGGSLVASAAAAQTAAPLRPDQAEFRGLYKELIETNTEVSDGSCTLAAQRMATRLKAAGLKDDQVEVFFTSDHPKDGGLVAVYPGTDKKLKPMLLLAHIDVVEAKRSDWTRDPFTLIEENGYFYGRGTTDDKAQAAIWTDTLIRFAKSGYKPKRTIKLALTCGEETSGAFNGAEWLSKNRRQQIDAAFALNEGGGGRTDGKGHLLVQSTQVGEKAYQDFTLTATNPGGHSSAPVRDNAIYAMDEALLKVRDHEFPLEFNDTTRVFFAKAGAMRPDAVGKAMVALAANPADSAAEAVVNQDRSLHSMLRTTCVATMVQGGHALNALPQTVKANVNCRMFPGRTAAETKVALAAAIGNPAITIEETLKDKPIAKSPPLDPKIMGPIEQLAARHFPGVPLVPTMSTGATDGVYMGAVGIPTYGVPGLWADPDLNGIHGLNERMEVKSLYAGRDYLFDLVKALSGK